VLQQREQTITDEVRCRLEPGAEQEDDGADQFVVTELVTLLLDVDELGEQVVGRSARRAAISASMCSAMTLLACAAASS